MEWKVPEIELDTEFGAFSCSHHHIDGIDMLALAAPLRSAVPLVRFHSSCVLGEALHDEGCDCRQQLHASLSQINDEGGYLIYSWEEGRGAGIAAKMQALALEQTARINTAEAFARLDLPPEPRTFAPQSKLLKSICTSEKVRLATNNPHKIRAVEEAGFVVSEAVELEMDLSEKALEYRKMKERSLGHRNGSE